MTQKNPGGNREFLGNRNGQDIDKSYFTRSDSLCQIGPAIERLATSGQIALLSRLTSRHPRRFATACQKLGLAKIPPLTLTRDQASKLIHLCRGQDDER